MDTYTTETEEFGTIHFTAPGADEAYPDYVLIETERGYASKEPRQICYGGQFRGVTVIASKTTLEEAGQRWLLERRAFLRNEELPYDGI